MSIPCPKRCGLSAGQIVWVVVDDLHHIPNAALLDRHERQGAKTSVIVDDQPWRTTAIEMPLSIPGRGLGQVLRNVAVRAQCPRHLPKTDNHISIMTAIPEEPVKLLEHTFTIYAMGVMPVQVLSSHSRDVHAIARLLCIEVHGLSWLPCAHHHLRKACTHNHSPLTCC